LGLFRQDPRPESGLKTNLANVLDQCQIGFVLALFGRPVGPNRMLFVQSGVSPAAMRTVKLSPALVSWLFRKTCTTLNSGGLVAES
jgi:hypothetical protein